MKSFKDLKKELLKDPEIKQAYQELEPEFALIEAIIKKRLEKGLTQKELAKKIGTKQSAISRFESGEYNPSLSLITKIAQALNAKIKIEII
ncbi:MAG: transcriptional regulator, XRE family [uncultured bacterium]|uniref:Helix-turn-helix domain protein n=1 Tax=Candidatus Daviesbacteria bacterium GW2011_GWC2_40_12 TaxID=1618431 RepID=A0A0G0QLI4_9BACT|nr:MAG: transcriptional regulator, XRE family [uncultured bacterium]KKQ82922.1 MAG: Helix-turn-helix domain protein [Candidatus Daviesbacteria bacterium GW2011_GWF2_38_7]KKR15568.1 MAG: Helix-turn-helix domain protein [Candidatus Daviesbacteria bacterium GW2011_GWA2_39_33]KKR24150.1 MAG: Helix-turn-helix domain protein [Candidatus Daviesbacteria bacterium GW2011_GWB1_39_5]KKR41289.1 MAG: Helix-turn-helix domain protein [Candidatus Daviesbacteria bacterium GW2011_GWC2_40_12]OGE22131.1 MAG: tran